MIQVVISLVVPTQLHINFDLNATDDNNTCTISISTSIFNQPPNTGTNMTIGVNAPILNQFEGGQIGAFFDIEWGWYV